MPTNSIKAARAAMFQNWEVFHRIRPVEHLPLKEVLRNEKLSERYYERAAEHAEFHAASRTKRDKRELPDYFEGVNALDLAEAF